MGWLSLCVCGANDDEKAKRNGTCKPESGKKSKRSRKRSKRKGSCEASPCFAGEASRNSQDESQRAEKEIAERTNGEIVNRRDQYPRRDRIDRADPAIPNDSPSDTWSSRIESDRNDDAEESHEGNAQRNAARRCAADHGDVSHSRCTSSTLDGNTENEEVECTWDEKEHDGEEANRPDDSAPRSPLSVEHEDSSWISEADGEDKPATTERSFDRRHEERISSRINLSDDEREISAKKERRNALPPIKRRPRAKARDRTNNHEKPQREERANKFGFKKSGLFCEQREIRRKLNSCSFEIRPFENEERNGKTTRIRTEGSMIPRLASPVQRETSSLGVDKSAIVQNGRNCRARARDPLHPEETRIWNRQSLQYALFNYIEAKTSLV